MPKLCECGCGVKVEGQIIKDRIRDQYLSDKGWHIFRIKDVKNREIAKEVLQ